VAPTATVTNSGPTTAGSAVTFTVSNLSGPDPNASFTYLVDWTGSGQFAMVPPDQVSGNSYYGVSFSHVYAQASPSGGYQAVVRLMDQYGGFTDYAQTVVVN